MKEFSDKKTLEKILPTIKVHFDEIKKSESSKKMFVSVGYPDYDEKEIMAALEALIGLHISQGKYVKEFEALFSQYMGIKHAIAVNSGSSANLLAVSALIENKDLKAGDEVIVPAATFPTVASPLLQLGLVPVFVDVEKKSYNIDPTEIRKGISKKTKMIMPVHSLGNPCEMMEIMEIAQENNLKVLEDCCEAHGSKIGNIMVGSFGDLSTISLFVAHNITTGEGGVVFTNNDEYESLARSLREFGRISQNIGRFAYEDKYLGNYDKRYVFLKLGYNLRMTDIAASIGIQQLKKLDKVNDKRISNTNYYTKKLAEFEEFLGLPETKKGNKHTFYAYPITIKKNAPFGRNEMAKFLEEQNIETRPFFAGCLPDQPAFREKPHRVVGDLMVSRRIRDRTLFIGCHQKLGSNETNYVVKKISEFIESKRKKFQNKGM